MGAGCGSAWLSFGVSAGGICAGFRTFRTCHRLALVLWCRVPAFLSALSLCACRVACKYGSISRFKGVFSAFYGVCVGLCCLRALRGLWGFCVRERLGGLKACGAFCLYVILSFAFLFLSLFLFFIFFSLFAYLLGLCLCCSLLVLLSCLCGSLGVLLFPFPFRYIRKKRGRKVFPLRPLFACYPYSNVLYIFHSFMSVAFSSTKE